MIRKLKRVCELDYVFMLEKLFMDVGLSKDLSDKFRLYHTERKLSPAFDFQVQVFSSRYWPLKQSETTHFSLPLELATILENFYSFYSSITSGRKLQWLHNHSKGSISFLSRYTFQVSIYQMAVLLLYNSNDSYSIRELVELTSSRFCIAIYTFYQLSRQIMYMHGCLKLSGKEF